MAASVTSVIEPTPLRSVLSARIERRLRQPFQLLRCGVGAEAGVQGIVSKHDLLNRVFLHFRQPGIGAVGFSTRARASCASRVPPS